MDKDKMLGDKMGSSCHQCKSRRNKSVLLWCSSLNSSKQCKKKYCDNCLKKFYNQSIFNFTEVQQKHWKCPACENNCSCAACRRRISTMKNFKVVREVSVDHKIDEKFSIEDETNSEETEEKFSEYGDVFNLLYETAQNKGNRLKMIQVLADSKFDKDEKIKKISDILQEGIYLQK
ncbi:hypothetical protein MHBO_001973 [Bonamia ostreae]|uniref:Zinc-finger domain-containing protein n=1 Tax=Bonamia ostreae TaxID=126728 RepID=A0ABV2ALU0_9EUKA